MSHKRPLSTPLPIFNKGKRPRQALLAHPNNQEGISHEFVHVGVKAKGQQYDELFGHNDNGSTINRENMNPSYVQKQQQPSNTGMQRNSNFTPYPCNQGKNLTSKSWHHERSTPQHPSARGHVKNTAETGPNVHSGRQFAAADQSVTAVGNSSITAVGNTTAQAHEPTEAANFDRASSQSDRPRKQELRVLTATAQGIEHWSQYRQHAQFLFEVYGTLVSTTKHDPCAQLFTLRTPDGPLKCIFWEMESAFPASIGKGQGVRVVGSWEPGPRRLKCYSVRQVLKDEESTVGQCVMAADRHLRRLVARL